MSRAWREVYSETGDSMGGARFGFDVQQNVRGGEFSKAREGYWLQQGSKSWKRIKAVRGRQYEFDQATCVPGAKCATCRVRGA